MDRIKKLSRVEENGCWTWLGTTDGGRPIIRLKDPRRLYPAQRYAYERWNQVALPKGTVVVARTCSLMRCVNPSHATAVLRGVQAHKKWGMHPPEYCQNGHEFSQWNTGTQRGSDKFCKACWKDHNRENVAKWRAKNPEHEVATRRARYEKKRAWVRDYKVACVVCGESDPDVLDFHHRDPAEKDVTIASVVAFVSKARLDAEIAKCDVLCSNCHRKAHAHERGLSAALKGLHGTVDGADRSREPGQSSVVDSV